MTFQTERSHAMTFGLSWCGTPGPEFPSTAVQPCLPATTSNAAIPALRRHAAPVKRRPPLRGRPGNGQGTHWVHWYNHRRLFEPLGQVPPAAFEAHYYRQLQESATTT